MFVVKDGKLYPPMVANSIGADTPAGVWLNADIGTQAPDNNYSKLETGKDSETHKDVKMWHYFVNDIYFAEYGEEEYEPYTVTINVKEKNDGDFVYSFSAEKESPTRQTLHADVNTYRGANGELFFRNNSTDEEICQQYAERVSNDELIEVLIDVINTSKEVALYGASHDLYQCQRILLLPLC